MIKQISAPISIPYDAIQTFCNKWNIIEFALFGSVLTDEFHDGSDIDIMVSFADEVRITLFDMVTMTDDLEAIFCRKVDFVTRRSVEQSDNYLRKENILNSAQVIYE